MSDYYILITDAGAALEVSAHTSGTPVELSEFGVCDGGVDFIPDPTQTTFANEEYRGPISSLTPSSDDSSALVAQCVIPAKSGGYTIRGIAIYTSDGTLYATGNYANQDKPAPDSGFAVSLEILAQLAVSDTADVTLTVTDATYLTESEADTLYLRQDKYLSEIASAGSSAQSAARGYLGLGNSATKDTGTADGTVAAGDDSRITGALQSSKNLSDLDDAADSRKNMGLKTAAVLDVVESDTDVTTGRVPVVGWLGIGLTSQDSNTIDFDSNSFIAGQHQLVNMSESKNVPAAITNYLDGIAYLTFYTLAADFNSGDNCQQCVLFASAYGAYNTSKPMVLLCRDADGAWTGQSFYSTSYAPPATDLSGYQKLNTASLGARSWFHDTSTGFIIQTATDSVWQGSSFSYPIAFPNTRVVISGTNRTTAEFKIDPGVVGFYDITETGASLSADNGSIAVGVDWIATGGTAPAAAKSLLELPELTSQYYYSAANNAFYAAKLYADYIYFNTWPDDAISVDDSVFAEFAASSAPDGKYRVAGDDGMPTWSDIPAPTQEQVVASNMRTYNRLLRACIDAAFPLQSAVALGIATVEQQSALAELQQYAVELTDPAIVDLTQSPVLWPTPPV
ncbi:phage tail protein [Citrobacter sp. ANG330]|uniref:phage tail-collar fiber domain-containing protein n=1 Tax=Citrobacter sp. ANG330 TaxID=3048142 RepID=UPI0039C2E135